MGPDRITWEQLLSFARKQSDAAQRNEVTPNDGSQMVRMVLEFHEALTVKVRREPDESAQR